VRNRRDGSVEALVCGAPGAVADFIAWAQRGPPAARVDSVDVSESDEFEHDDFVARPDD
jgi:acylphosphatase